MTDSGTEKKVKSSKREGTERQKGEGRRGGPTTKDRASKSRHTTIVRVNGQHSWWPGRRDSMPPQPLVLRRFASNRRRIRRPLLTWAKVHPCFQAAQQAGCSNHQGGGSEKQRKARKKEGEERGREGEKEKRTSVRKGTAEGSVAPRRGLHPQRGDKRGDDQDAARS